MNPDHLSQFDIVSRMPRLLLCPLLLAATTLASAAVKVEKTAYDGWPNCYRITNGEVELIVTTDIGPRIMRYAFVGGKNVFVEFKEELGKSGEAKWYGRGGHRLWSAPEIVPDTYALDNGPVKITVQGDTVTLLQPVEKETHLQKEITVKLAATGSDVEVIHTIKNAGAKPRKMALWALTQMAPGGLAIALFPPRGSHDTVLSPTNPLTMWAYTNFSDPRWTFTKKYILLQMQPGNKDSQKTGLFNPKTAAGYLLGSDLFVKKTVADPKAEYPDFGCSYETYTADTFLEMETLSPLTVLQPGKSATHTEHWSLHKGVTLSGKTDDAIDRAIGRYLQ
jgi:hypothetical protein